MPNVRKVIDRIEKKVDEILSIEHGKPVLVTKLGVQVTKVQNKTENW